DRGVVIEQVSQVIGRVLAQPLARLLLGTAARCPDEAATAATTAGLEQTVAPELDQRLSEGHGGDAELRCQSGLGRKLLPFGEHAQSDRLREPTLDRTSAAV